MNHVIVSRAHQRVLAPNIPGVASMFPAAPLLPPGNDARIIPHGMRETLMLRHLGFTVPNPMELYYDWCGASGRGCPPFGVQIATCRLLTENPRAYVLNHMGTGKTKTVLWAWDYLNRAGLAKKMLVVSPLSTLRFVWQAEAFSTLPGRVVKILHGSKRERLERLGEDADIYVINHDGLKVIESELQARADIDTLVLDELAVYRNPSDRTKRMKKFAARFDKVWGLTGSPMPNEPTDVWSQCQIITPNNVPRFRTHARDLLMMQTAPHIWRPKADAVQRAFSWMRPACRYSLEDVTELPAVISRTIDVPLSADAERVYKRVATAMHALIGDKTITAVNAGAAMNKLLQIAGGWVYTENPTFVRVDPTPRLVALADLIRSAERKVIVAVPYRHMIEGISDILNMKGVDIAHSVVHGGVTAREDIFNQFQNTDAPRVMLVHPACVSHGLTLTAADTMIWYLPVTSLDVYDQLNARITRIGQTHKQQIIHLQATAIERKVYTMLRSHQKMQETFLQLVEEATGAL